MAVITDPASIQLTMDAPRDRRAEVIHLLLGRRHRQLTIVNGVSNEQVGRVIECALDNPKRTNSLSFQPVSFTGRDEEVTPECRAAQRHTLSHLAPDVKKQIGIGEPVRDWFPISFMSTFTDLARRPGEAPGQIARPLQENGTRR